MRDLKLGKILNKTIILIVTLALLCSMSVSAAVTLDAVVTKDNATLTVSCGDSFAGKNVVVQVFEPTTSVEDLVGDGNYTETDTGILENTLVCVYHGKLDDEGNVTFKDSKIDVYDWVPTISMGEIAISVVNKENETVTVKIMGAR